MGMVLYLLAALAFLGGFDTLYYHEWRAKLPAMGNSARSELRLHALRDFVYAILFLALPWIAWHGLYALVLTLLFLIEVFLTLWDFVVEDWVRKPLGGLYPGERITHAVMGIVYGAMVASIVPTLRVWWSQPTEFIKSSSRFPAALSWTLTGMAVGVFLSGIRDLSAAEGVRGSAWPWREVGGQRKPLTLRGRPNS